MTTDLLNNTYSSIDEHFRNRRIALIIQKIQPNKVRGILVVAAREATEDIIAETLNCGGGHLRVALSASRVEALNLQPITRQIDNQNGFSFGQGIRAIPAQKGLSGVEAREGVTTGISAADRSTTVRVLGSLNPAPHLIVQPGHIFPVAAHQGGILARADIPEAALSIVENIWQQDAALYVEVLNENGEYPNEPELHSFAKLKNYPIYRIEDIIYRSLVAGTIVERIAEANLPTKRAGILRSIIFRSSFHEGEHIALVKGFWRPEEDILVRVQSEQTFTDVFGGESRKQLELALERIGAEGRGVVVYLRKPEAGWLSKQISGQDEEFGTGSTYSMRAYGVGAAILRNLGVSSVRLLTAQARPRDSLITYGIRIKSQMLLATGDEV